MIAKIAILFAVVAVAYGGVVGVANLPASTALLADRVIAQPAITYAAQPIVQHVAAAPAITYASQPVVQYAAQPAITYAAAPTVIQHAAKVVQTYEPVEQHGYKIVY
ncbi:hypothetical protein Ocin01_16710 [Orchesella cincta]|uniref:Cuticle protein n=1 Tax=Orchesella cincta TaxID=48709 RepID=A0A1D2MAG9_ORCCI|nr:hypothetical protein Ocin01_16710 [Orchesella cincta]